MFYGYLALYNLVYVLPLLAIVLFFAQRLGARKLSEQEGRVLKLLSGVMMALLGLLLILAPGQLSNPVNALAMLLVAFVVTWLAVKFAPQEQPIRVHRQQAVHHPRRAGDKQNDPSERRNRYVEQTHHG
jgi:uncharacterized membrane protein HdeD (DUF308 family)